MQITDASHEREMMGLSRGQHVRFAVQSTPGPYIQDQYRITY